MPTVADLLSSLRSLHLLEPAQLEKVAAVQAKIPEPQALLKKLVSERWLTAFQAKQLYAGRGNDLVLGSYVLLDRLGEGGMGEVYKAKNWKLGKLVALKVIRKERLKSPMAVKRFEREVKTAAQLSHPNIIQAYDAGQVGTTHFFAMEFVEGQDLMQMVKQSGPLPIDKACDYIRQAALGLQHAHEKGMVHRDIKPSNLLVSQGASPGVVKLLDMGLARMDQGEDATTLTQEGSVLGTIDYLAPEQAMDAHKADIRSDLYSLGCTFYYILTGQPAFGGGTATEKLLKHRLEEPKRVEELRREVPAPVAGIVRKMMAKRPEDRYQTPAELVGDLTGKVGRLAKASPPTNGPLLSGAQAAVGKARRNWKWLAGGAAAALLLLFVLGKIISSGDGDGKPAGTKPVAGGTKPTGGKPTKPAEVEPRYVKMATREETILATLRSAGLPTLEGKWYTIGYFELSLSIPPETVYPPEKEIDLAKAYPGKNKQMISWKENADFKPGNFVQFVGLFGPLPHHLGSITYFHHTINAPEALDLPVRFSGEDFLFVFLNGEPVFSRKGLGPYNPDQNAATLRLKPGKNQLLLKACNAFGKAVVYVCPEWPAKLEATFGDNLRRDFSR